MRTFILAIIVFSSVSAIDVTYRSDIRCPISGHWCFQLAHYEDGWMFDEFLGQSSVICSKTAEATVTIRTQLLGLEIDGWYEPYVLLKHNCSMHENTLHKYTITLPRVPTDPAEDHFHYQMINLNDQGDEYEKFLVEPKVIWA